MKSVLLVICAFGFLMESDAEKPFILEGRMTGKDAGIIYLKYNRKGFLIADSARLENNFFVFRGLLDEPILASLSYRADPRSPRTEIYSDFYLEPANLKVQISWNKSAETSLQGSAVDKEYQLLKSLANPVLFGVYRLQREVSAGAPKSDSLHFLQNQGSSILTKFISENPLSIASAHAMVKLINLQDLSADSGLVLLRSLAPDVQQSEYCRGVMLNLSMIANSAVGHSALDFSRTDINGKTFSLNDLKGKYVLLEYWASWCGPCRELTPTIKEYYRKYRDLGFEIVFISCDSKYDAWKKAVTDDSIENFTNVLSFSNEDMEFLKTRSNLNEASFRGELRKLYNLMPIPAEILIDKEGKIIGRYGVQDGEPRAKLEEKLTTLKN